MIYELRKYTCRPGTVHRQIAFYRVHGLRIQAGHLGYPIAYGACETGDVNSFVHVWKFDDVADRDRRRTALYADDAWLRFLKTAAEQNFLLSQESTLVNAADFMEEQGRPSDIAEHDPS